MRKVLILTIILILMAFAVSAQEEWYQNVPIFDIVFEGLNTISEGELKPIVRPYVGEPFTLDLFWDIQEKLYALDYFESIESNALPVDEQRQSVIIEFRVVEKPSVTAIVLEGNRRLGKSEILEKILIKKGDMVNQAQVDSDAAAIRELYKEKGFMAAEVSGSLEEIKDEQAVRVVFIMKEGIQTRIEAIIFSGNEFASDSALRKTIKTKAQALFSRGLFQESLFQEDIGRIQDYYGEHGYIDGKVVDVDRRVERDDEEEMDKLYITIYIEEGEQYTYGGVSFEGNQIFDDELLSSLVRQKEGKLVNTRSVEFDFQRVTNYYYENGYIFNIIDREELRDEEKKEVSYLVRIVENDRAHIENIIIKGNDKTRDNVIFRELPFVEGDIFNKTKVIQGLRNLYNTQYFSVVAPETPQGSADGLMDLVINVEEGNTATINFGVMFSGGDYPVTGMFKWGEINFLGKGQTISADLELSPLRQLVSFQFEEPWMFGKRWLGGVNLNFEHAIVPNVLMDMLPPTFNGDEDDAVPDPYTGMLVDPDTGIGPYGGSDAITDYEYDLLNGSLLTDNFLMEYTVWRITAGIDTGYRYYTPLGWLGARGGLSTGLEFVTYDQEHLRPFDPEIRSGLETWSVVNKFGLTLYWDKRDYFLNPSEGFYVAQAFTYTGGILGGDRDYIRTDSTLEGFVTLLDTPLSDTWNLKLVLAAHSSLSMIYPQFGGTETTVPTDLLYVDGWTVARGWPFIDDRRALWDNRLELRLPLAEQIIWWTFFLDGVVSTELRENIWNVKRTDFLFSLGGGIRFTIPQFPIRLYLAQRFHFDREDSWHIDWEKDEVPLFGKNSGLKFVISLGGDLF
jgi:outer membrane protein insertion porin family